MRALVLDHGLFIELALRLAHELDDTVGYFSPWASAFPNPQDQLLGTGLEDFGVKRVDFPWELFETSEEPDIYIFPDLLFTDQQTLLRKLGRQVWGSGWGELLEMNRWKLQGLLEDAGWPAPETERLTGVDALLKRLKNESESLFVKLAPYYRGLMETYEHRGWPDSRTWYDKVRSDLGMRGDTMDFMLQRSIPGEKVVEPGFDLIIKDGRILYPTLIGYEKKGSALISKVIEELPDVVAGPIETVVEALSKEGSPYSNFFSAELRVNEDGEAYFIDATARAPRPGDGADMELWTNLGEIVTSDSTEPLAAGQYAVQLMLDSPQAEKRPLHIRFPEEKRDNIKLYQFYRDPQGQYWTLPRGISNVVSVTVVGDDLDKIQKECLEIAKEVKFDGSEYEEHAFDKILEDIETGRDNGVDWD